MLDVAEGFTLDGVTYELVTGAGSFVPILEAGYLTIGPTGVLDLPDQVTVDVTGTVDNQGTIIAGVFGGAEAGVTGSVGAFNNFADFIRR